MSCCCCCVRVLCSDLNCQCIPLTISHTPIVLFPSALELRKPNLAFFVGGGHSSRVRRRVTLSNTYSQHVHVLSAEMQSADEKHFVVEKFTPDVVPPGGNLSFFATFDSDVAALVHQTAVVLRTNMSDADVTFPIFAYTGNLRLLNDQVCAMCRGGKGGVFAHKQLDNY